MDEVTALAIGVAYVVLAFIVMLVAKLVKDWLTPYRIDRELTRKDNPALGLTLTGYLAATIIIFLGAAVGPVGDPDGAITSGQIARQIGIDFLWAMGGILALNLGRVVVDRLVLHRFSMVKEIIEDGNAGAGAVEFGCYIATGLVVAGAISGEGGGILTALAFFALGQLVFVLFANFYQWITRYDIHAEIERDNVAAGVALGVSMIAIGILLFRATTGDFVGWGENLLSFAYYAVVGFILLFILRRVTDAWLLPGTTIAHEIAEDRNLNAGLIEGMAAVGMASVIAFMI